MKLNKEQILAVKHDKGPLLIIAGAGTGKTAVIIERIKHLIASGKAKPEEILALTFTEKAATEMEVRIDEAMPLSYGDIWITTFHSFCDSILRESGLHIGLPTNFKLMTKEKSIDLFKRNLFNFSLNYFRPLGNPNKFIDSLLTHFSRLQDEAITPSEYIAWVKKLKASKTQKLQEDEKLEQQKWQELATVYNEYNELKLKEAKFDFGDLIIKTIELFKKRPNILKNYQEKFKYILVDEFQDTNYAQNELVNLIAQKTGNITVVGDDNQSIYRWRGAAISNILQFIKVYPKAKIITLNQNYRSTQTILDSAYKLIKHNDPDTLEARLKIPKILNAKNSNAKYEIKTIQTQTGDEEAEEVIKSINQLIIKYNYQPKDIAILVRANNHADSFIRELERQGIPHQFLGPSKLLEKEEIVDLISYLKSLYDPEDNESFYRLISSKNLDINISEIIKITSEAKKKSVSVFEIFNNNNTHSKLKEIFTKHLQEINTKTAGEILFEYLQVMGIYEEIIKNEDDIKAKNISAFFQKVKAFENDNPQAKLREVVDYINLLTEVGDSPTVTDGLWQENNAVNILTIHSAKGLEFPVVFMVNLVTDRFPSRNRGDDLPIPDELIKEELPIGDFHIQEERRLFYVGITRAKERLYFTSARIYNDGKREKKISPFVAEALGETANSQQPTVNSKKRIYNINNQHSSQFTVHSSRQKVNFLSVSQIETFQTCPLHYKLKYIYNFPTPSSASTSFGISIHESLKQMLNAKNLNAKLTQDIFENCFREEGYENKKHKKLFFDKGKEYLLGFLKNSYDPKTKTVALEQKFNIKLSKDLTVGGVIDRIDEISKGRFEIIDYKTGANIPSQKDVDKDLQLSVYALAVSEMYKVKPENIKLSLYYLDTQEKITTIRTEEELQEIRNQILEIRDEIENSDFKCNNSYFCQKGCEFKMFCKSEGL
jgi:DNA helicase-2/ATP-dependent DNA helicase PcrA